MIALKYKNIHSTVSRPILILAKWHIIFYLFLGKARRLKQAKEEAQDEIEKYRQEREKQFKEFEIKVNI